MSADEWRVLVEEAQQAVDTARQVAEAAPHPEPASVTRFVLSEPGFPQQVGGLAAEGIEMMGGTAVANPPDPRRINMIEAIRRTLDVEMALNPRCLVFGEDVGLKGGVHAATLGLQTKYSERRVGSLGFRGVLWL